MTFTSRAIVWLATLLAGGGGFAQTPPAANAATASEPVATVNGVVIRRHQLTELSALRGPDGGAPGASPGKLLDDLVMAELLAQKARAAGLDALPATQAEIEIQHKTLLGQRLLRQFAREVRVDDAELRARYANAPAEVELNTRHILLADEAQARQVIARLNRGEPFATLARTLSTDTASAPQGGALGVMQAAELAPPYAQAAQALRPGRYSRKPVQTEFGWHVIQLVSAKPVKKPAFAAVRDGLRQQVVSERVEAQVLKLRDEARIRLLQSP